MKTPPDHLPADTLWLGAHKTGTTFLQKSLDLSQPNLRAGGVHYRELAEFRRLYTRPLLHADHPDTPEPPPKPFRGQRQNLIFDENIMALVQHVLSPRRLYPDAARRAQIIAEHLGLVRPRIVLGLRSFRHFLPSLYCETLKATPFQRFRSFYVIQPRHLSWSDLVIRLGAAFPLSEVHVYTAEVLRGREAALLAHVTGLDPGAFTLLDGAERPGFSHKAVRQLLELEKTQTVTNQDVVAANQRFPRGAEFPGFDPWKPEEAAALDRRYAADLVRLETLPGVRFLDPELRALQA